MNNENLKPFVKGDKRINRNGRPKSFDALRKLAVRIAGETIPGASGEDITRIEAMLKVMSSSKNPADKALFLAYAYGKPKEELNVNFEKPLVFDYAKFINSATRPIEDSDPPGQDEGSLHGEAVGKDGDGGGTSK
jgi:hypothetical protein